MISKLWSPYKNLRSTLLTINVPNVVPLWFGERSVSKGKTVIPRWRLEEHVCMYTSVLHKRVCFRLLRYNASLQALVKTYIKMSRSGA